VTDPKNKITRGFDDVFLAPHSRHTTVKVEDIEAEPDLELTDNRSQIQITSSSPAYMGLLTDLLAWHQADPPDDAERRRNDVVFSFQGNRNPFIDRPEWGTRALFTSSRPATCQLVTPVQPAIFANGFEALN
jgi:hypothetical protein